MVLLHILSQVAPQAPIYFLNNGYLSSTSVYGSDGGAVSCNSKPATQSWYGTSKTRRERMLERLSDRM
ncbi:MAG: hypothetical protein GWP91_16805 [Rhodobacterales bacterium]|nr:hypothetical protein [Rhodobacterales bacterium]